MIMKLCKVCITLATKQSHLAHNLNFILFGRETPVQILYIPGRHDDIPGNFNKIPVIAAGGTGYPAQGLPGWDVYFLFRQNFSSRLMNLSAINIES
jgi:hypothetical protein